MEQPANSPAFVSFLTITFATTAVIVGGFLYGFRFSAYGLAGILGLVTFVPPAVLCFSVHRSQWITTTITAVSAITLITLTAGIANIVDR